MTEDQFENGTFAVPRLVRVYNPEFAKELKRSAIFDCFKAGKFDAYLSKWYANVIDRDWQSCFRNALIGESGDL